MASPAFQALATLLLFATPVAVALEPYVETIPGAEVGIEMVPVEGGVVRLPVGPHGGDPAFAEVELPAFWIGKHEITWGAYRQYMELDKVYGELQQLAAARDSADAEAALSKNAKLRRVLTEERTADGSDLAVDAVTAPTPLYDPSTTYESGDEPNLPAVTMSPFAAQQFTKWLSGLTGREYRLPSEAEWLHAAGEIMVSDKVAWHTDNSDWVAHPVGGKAPNALGLHDMLGNAAELVLDAHRPEGRPRLAGRRVGWPECVAWPQEGEERIAKGGWYDAEVEELTTTARMPTDKSDWSASDPNLPLSPWWYADYPATGVGFRLVRVAEPMSPETRRKVWDTLDANIAQAVTERLREGRGKIGPANSDWPTILEQLRSPEVRALLK